MARGPFDATHYIGTVDPFVFGYPFTLFVHFKPVSGACIGVEVGNPVGQFDFYRLLVDASGRSQMVARHGGASAEHTIGPTVGHGSWVRLAIVATSPQDRALWVNEQLASHNSQAISPAGVSRLRCGVNATASALEPSDCHVHGVGLWAAAFDSGDLLMAATYIETIHPATRILARSFADQGFMPGDGMGVQLWDFGGVEWKPGPKIPQLR